jgi:hypothetical protein
MSDNTDSKTPSAPVTPAPPTPVNHGRGRRDNGPLKREYVKEFVDANSRIAVRVQKTEKYRPQYSIVIGKLAEHENGTSFVPYLPVIVVTNLAKVQSITDHSKVIAVMVQEATEWVHKACQDREDEIIDEQKKKYEEQDSRRGYPQKPGLKQLVKIDRAIKNYGG